MTIDARGAELLGRTLGGRYRLEALLGTGASAGVYRARDVSLGRRVAVKVLHPGVASDPAFRKRFRAEARAAASLSHPHILAVHDWGEDDGAYLVSELLEGGSLRDLLADERRLSCSQALVVGLQAAQGLDFAHRHGLVHRDIKPANLLFGGDGRLRIADFGIARAVAESSWTEPQGSLVGTARYAAPEQAGTGALDGRTDVYALALTLLEAVTGEVPLTASSPLATMALRQSQSVPVPDSLGPLAEVLRRAGSRHPSDRPTAAALAEGLLAAAGQLERPEPLPLRPLSPPRAEVDVDLTLPWQPGPAHDTVVGNPRPGDEAPPLPAAVAAPGAVAPAGRAVVFDLDRVEPVDGGTEASDGPRPGRRRRRWPWLVLALVVALAAAGGFWQYQRTRIPTHEVGSYLGATVEVVRAEAEANGWILAERPERRDGTEAGEVLEQAPPPGERLAEGAQLAVVVSEGQLLRAVPELVGLASDEAQAALVAQGLTAGEVRDEHHEDVPAGHVVSASASAGSELETGTAVDLVVSAGPAPRTVPDVASSSPADAVVAIEALGLVPLVAEEHHGQVPEGAIIAVVPAPGEVVERGSEVRVVVSLGRPFVTVPDVVGLDAAEASDRLEAAGFVVVDTIGPPNRPVLITDPPAGEVHREGKAVTVITRSS